MTALLSIEPLPRPDLDPLRQKITAYALRLIDLAEGEPDPDTVRDLLEDAAEDLAGEPLSNPNPQPRATGATVRLGVETKESAQTWRATVGATPGDTPLALIPTPPQPGAYPVERLPPLARDAAAAIASLTQCPPALSAQSVLAVAAAAVQGHHDAAHPLGHAVPCSLLLVTIAESGERKSTADALAAAGITTGERQREAAYRMAYADWRSVCEAREAARAAVKSRRRSKGAQPLSVDAIAEALAEIGPDPAPPMHPRRVIGDPNYEGLLAHMRQAHGSLAWMNNEAGQAIGGTAMSDENRLKFAAGLSRLWDGQPVDKLRAMEGVTVLRDRRLTTHLMVQPAVAQPFLQDKVLRAQGWLARALVVEPVSTIGSRLFREPEPADRAALQPFHDRVAELVDRPCPLRGEAQNELAPAPLPWSSAARRLWVDFHDDIERQLAAGAALEEHRASGAKLAENAFRLATVAAGLAGAREVDAQTMGDAIALAGWYGGALVEHSAAVIVSEHLRTAEALRAWLSERWKGETVTFRDIMRGAPRAVRTSKRKAEGFVRTLIEHGWLAPQQGEALRVWRPPA